MLSAILAAIREAGRPLCLVDLSRDLGIDEPALEGMVETLVARGRLRAIRFDGPGCDACPGYGRYIFPMPGAVTGIQEHRQMG